MIAGVAIVRNEEDILPVTVRHHLREGFDFVLIADNDSSDGTRQALARLAAHDRRVEWLGDTTGSFRQAEVVTELARDAHRRGARWIVPFDADELWHAHGGIRRVLANRTESALEVAVTNFVQHRTQTVLEPAALLRVDRRIAQPGAAAPELVETGALGYVEMEWPPKWISRAASTLEIGPGNHVVSVEGPRGRLTEVRCLHVPLRARAVLEEKAEHGRRLNEAGFEPSHGWHVRRIARLAQEGRLDEEWAANSHRKGILTTADGRVVPLVVDTTVRDLVRPLIGPPRLPRLFGRSRIAPA
jgi:hypothetical protein